MRSALARAIAGCLGFASVASLALLVTVPPASSTTVKPEKGASYHNGFNCDTICICNREPKSCEPCYDVDSQE